MNPPTLEQQLPALDSPYGPNVWNQPPRDSIAIDATHALMTRGTFEALVEYSGSLPTGAYPGKLWRRHDGIFDRQSKEPPKWLLGWYGPTADPSKVSINFREVLIV